MQAFHSQNETQQLVYFNIFQYLYSVQGYTFDKAEFVAFCHLVCTVYKQYNDKQNDLGFGLSVRQNI